MKVLLASLIALTPVSVSANEYQAGYSHERKCYRSEYREEYVSTVLRDIGDVMQYKESQQYIDDSLKETENPRIISP